MSENTLNSDLNNHRQPVGLSMEFFKREGIGIGQGIKERAHMSKVGRKPRRSAVCTGRQAERIGDRSSGRWREMRARTGYGVFGWMV